MNDGGWRHKISRSQGFLSQKTLQNILTLRGLNLKTKWQSAFKQLKYCFSAD